MVLTDMIKIIVADDHPIVREGLKRIILDCKDMKLVGEAENGEEVLVQCGKTEFDVLLLDISMPGPGFLEVLHRLVTRFSGVRVLVLSIHPEDHYAIRALKAGASGYLTKNHSPYELEQAIRFVYSGHKYVSSELAEKMASQISEHSSLKLHERLSNREYQILNLIGTGEKISEIAKTLKLSPKTVSTYQSRILDKMNLKSRGELIRYVVENDLST